MKTLERVERSASGARAPDAPSLGPTLDFLRLLWELDHALQRRSKRMARALGLTGPQRLVLRIVGDRKSTRLNSSH